MVGSAKNHKAFFFTRESNPEFVQEIQRFRKRLFVDQLGWDLTVVDDQEIDEFDTQDTIYSSLFLGQKLVAIFRAIRTDQPYLAAEKFDQLASIRPFPRRRDIWEISRFGVDLSQTANRISLINYGLMFELAKRRHAVALVAIADPIYERYLAKLGVRTRRYGPPQVTGYTSDGSEIKCVAGEIQLNDQTTVRMEFFSQLLRDTEIYDETLVLGRERISA